MNTKTETKSKSKSNRPPLAIRTRRVGPDVINRKRRRPASVFAGKIIFYHHRNRFGKILHRGQKYLFHTSDVLNLHHLDKFREGILVEFIPVPPGEGKDLRATMVRVL